MSVMLEDEVFCFVHAFKPISVINFEKAFFKKLCLGLLEMDNNCPNQLAVQCNYIEFY